MSLYRSLFASQPRQLASSAYLISSQPLSPAAKLIRLCASILLPSCLLLTGCDRAANESSDTVAATDSTADMSIFAGCYTVSHDEPAQIKVSEQDGAWVMQMKEPKRANRVWDDPEVLQPMPLSEVSNYFSIDPNNLDAVLGRPDKVLVLAHVKSVYANIDPLLDSEYLSYIYKGANTIYKVDCDDVNTDILADPHANIIIDNVNDPVTDPQADVSKQQ